MKKIGIVSLGHYLPEDKLTNLDLEKLVNTSDEWITTRTGIKERRVIKKGEKTSNLAIPAAKEALEAAGLEASQVGLIIVATSTPDSGFPSTACLVQKALGAEGAAGFDISAACAGFLYAITTAKQFILSGLHENALVIAAETMTSVINWKDRNTCVLFGDGAGACVLKEVEEGGIISDYLHSKGEFADLMSININSTRHPNDHMATEGTLPYITMQGKELFKIAVNSMAYAVSEAAKKAGIDIHDIDCVVPHQANDRIISALAKKLDIPKEEIFVNIGRYGNMSAASIAVALYEAVQEGRIKKGSKVALVAFGAGLVSAANIVQW